MLFKGLLCLNSESFVFDEELLRNILSLGLIMNLLCVLLMSFSIRFVNDHNELTIMFFLLFTCILLLLLLLLLLLSQLHLTFALNQ